MNLKRSNELLVRAMTAKAVRLGTPLCSTQAEKLKLGHRWKQSTGPYEYEESAARVKTWVLSSLS